MTVKTFMSIGDQFSNLPSAYRFIDYKNNDVFEGEYLCNVPHELYDKEIVMTYNDTENDVLNLVIE